MKIKVLLFHTNPKSKLDSVIKFFTSDNFRHAAFIFPDVTGDLLFEATGFKNEVCIYRRLSQLKDCKVTILEFDIDTEKILKTAINKIGTKYDWKGLFLWALSKQKKGKLYCFEYIAACLAQGSGELHTMVSLIRDGSISGTQIYKVLKNIGATETIYEF